MTRISWRQEQLLTLAIAVVLSLGAGFVGGYFVHAWKSVEPSSADAALATTGKRQAPKSYERLVEEAGEQPAGVLDEDDARVICDEVPMDGLIGGRDTGPEPRLSDPDDAACVEARRSGDGLGDPPSAGSSASSR